MSVTYTASNPILNEWFGRTTPTVPVTYYFGLSTTPITDSGTGATEPSGGAYARVASTNDKTTWGVAASGALVNLLPITFVESSASWGTITYVFIADALTSGNVLFFDALSPSRNVQSATTVLFAAGAITVQMTNT